MAAPATPRAPLILPRASSQPSAGGLTSDRFAASNHRRGDFVSSSTPPAPMAARASSGSSCSHTSAPASLTSAT
ncbi:unnamed protein product [Urochloa humidicola]